MSKIILHRSFLDDVASNTDNAFSRRVLMSVIAELQGNPNRTNDHRYNGIDDAWIRYLSRGKTAYRLIYLRNGPDIIFYRCGPHSIEDKLSEPNLAQENLTELEIDDSDVDEMTLPKTFLTNHTQKLTLTALVGRRLIPNKEVWLVSPFLSDELLWRGSLLGRVLDALVNEGTPVYVVTALNNVMKYQKICVDLARRNIDVVFVPNLHSKIYLFLTDEAHKHRSAKTPSLGIVGSSNLTNKGVALQPGHGNMETNYTVPVESIPELTDLVHNYYCVGLDIQRATRRFKELEGTKK